jgi:hypothetical protein
MNNPATQPQDQMNNFTSLIQSLGHTRFGGWEKSDYWVLLSNGELVRPVFMPAEDDSCEDCFGVDHYRWNLDGTSVTSSNYDMMEIV